MKLIELEILDSFRGLQSGFKINFSRPLQKNNLVEPLCLVGVNGSGKSNMMQSLAEIFHFLECFVLPEPQTEEYFVPDPGFGFRLHYQLPVFPRNFLDGIDSTERLSTLTWRGVIITRQKDEDPVFKYYYDGMENIKTLYDATGDSKPLPENKLLSSRLLPNQVIGYSSGMNELISNPFTQMDFFYLDALKEKTNWNNQQDTDEPDEDANAADEKNVKPKKKRASVERTRQELTVNRLFYLDYQSNALMMLANFLIKEAGPAGNELDVIKEVVGMDDLVSFRILLNKRVKKEFSTQSLMQLLQRNRDNDEEFDLREYIEDMDLPVELNNTVLLLEDCCTTQNIVSEKRLEGNDRKEIKIELYFKVDAEMKRAFRDKFPGGPVTLFRGLYLLNLLNFENFTEETKYEIKSSGTNENITGMLPKVPPAEKVFVVDEIRLRKTNGKKLLYRQLSDGEHQYMQVAGSLMLINDTGSLFLMDEPETHFNPEWRSRLISTLNKIRRIQLENDTAYKADADPETLLKQQESLLPQQEILLTTHSPFVVSDCQADNVYIFERDKEKGVQIRKPQINTYGTSSHILLQELFKKDDTIANVSKAEIDGLEREIEQAATKAQLDDIKKKASHLGDSVEKFMMYYKLNTREKEISPDDDLLQLDINDQEPVPA